MIVVDTNLLVYAVNRDAAQHTAARNWWETTLSGTTQVALPWLVLLAFIGLTTNPRILRAPATADQALRYVDQWLQQPYVVPVNPGERHWTILNRLLAGSGTAGNLATDAHLAAIAIEYGYVLYSADNDFKRFDRLQHVNPLAQTDIHDTAASY